jgi:hypothetical protein
MFSYLLKTGNPFAGYAPSPLGSNFMKNKCMVYGVYSTSITFYNWAVPQLRRLVTALDHVIFVDKMALGQVFSVIWFPLPIHIPPTSPYLNECIICQHTNSCKDINIGSCLVVGHLVYVRLNDQL